MVGEKGGTWLTINDGQINKNADSSLIIPSSLAKKLRAFGSKFLDRMVAYEKTKKTMLSFEIKTGLEPEKFKEIQKETVPQIENIIKEESLEKDLIVDSTRIGTDIQYRKVGKGFAMERVLNWLKTKGIDPQKIICFGDSKSDFEMAEKTHEQGFQAEFVYVGGDNAFKNVKKEIPIKITKNKFEKGTLEFLKELTFGN